MSSFGLRDPRERLQRWLGALSLAERNRCSGPVSPAAARSAALSFERTALPRMLYFDQTSSLPYNLLEHCDRITMAASVAARMPFMDTELAAMTAPLPDSWRIRGITQKYILRHMMAGVLSEEILDRPRAGFRLPSAHGSGAHLRRPRGGARPEGARDWPPKS
jgi:asparagine synthase (glutamine-hydrolysing)